MENEENETGITDDAMVVERMENCAVKLVEGSYENIKITTPEDLILAESLIKKRNWKKLKKVLTIMYHYDIIYLVADTQQQLNKCGEVSKWS